MQTENPFNTPRGELLRTRSLSEKNRQGSTLLVTARISANLSNGGRLKNAGETIGYVYRTPVPASVLLHPFALTAAGLADLVSVSGLPEHARAVAQASKGAIAAGALYLQADDEDPLWVMTMARTAKHGPEMDSDAAGERLRAKWLMRYKSTDTFLLSVGVLKRMWANWKAAE